MPSLNEYQRYLLEEFAEEYLQGRLDRRELLRRAVLVTGSVASAAAALSMLGCSPANAPAAGAGPSLAATPSPVPAQATRPPAATATPVVGPDATVTPTDPAVQAREVTYPGPAGPLIGYLARPTQPGTYPGVIVIHENQGLTAHIEEVTRRIAKVGFIALAPDLVSRAGGTKTVADPARIAAALSQTPADDLTADLLASLAFLKQQPGVQPAKFGVFGFCFGGGYTYRLALASSEIAAATPWYGPAPPLDQVPNLRGAIWAVYAGNDARINASLPDLEAAMRASNKRFSYEIYPNTAHAFHRTTDNPVHMEAAKDAWQKMVDFLTRELKS
ncbi:MAG: dienelactone hydrolase family protein [Chloroflexota bacterium]|nr:dienelactone hydrolase family protein [Dehalococcoidia bacterium]MDW8253051.1 dienelactone hydrolase family protein [Chloroflexota bacterium]